jgi:hypothetical protein
VSAPHGTSACGAADTDSTVEGKRDVGSRGFVRSRQMADCLRRELLYSEKRPRDALFRAIEAILTEQAQAGETRILSRLTRDAASRARHEAHRVGFEFHHWDTASKAVVNAMLSAGVLLDPEGGAIPPGITAQATAVAGLRRAYPDLTEALLLETVIDRLGDVTTRDHKALAHALFRQFDRDVSIADMEDRVVILLAQLADRVDLRGDTYVARVR